MQQKFRVYALIHGQTLPLTELAGCKIQYMDFDEQKIRGFSPVQYQFAEEDEYYKTYATSLPFIDPMKLRTKHVAVCEIDESDAKAALGGSIKIFDKLCSTLFISGIKDMESVRKGAYLGETYLYQINKIYQLDNDGKENDVSLNLKSGHIFLPDRPERNSWRDENTNNFFEEVLKFNDPIFNKALKYIYSSSIGHYKLNSFEKIALDHFKSIELIINSLVNSSSVKDFKKRVDMVASILDLSTEEVSQIKKYWDSRSNSDIAHSDHMDSTSWYPNQFPVPTGIDYPWARIDSTAKSVLMKYFEIRKRYFHIDIEKPHDKSSGIILGTVNEHSDCNHLFFETNTFSKKSILAELKREFSRNFGIDEGRLEVNFLNSKNKASVFIKDSGFDIKPDVLTRKKIHIRL